MMENAVVLHKSTLAIANALIVEHSVKRFLTTKEFIQVILTKIEKGVSHYKKMKRKMKIWVNIKLTLKFKNTYVVKVAKQKNRDMYILWNALEDNIHF